MAAERALRRRCSSSLSTIHSQVEMETADFEVDTAELDSDGVVSSTMMMGNEEAGEELDPRTPTTARLPGQRPPLLQRQASVDDASLPAADVHVTTHLSSDAQLSQVENTPSRYQTR